jgi:hypothetical protein
MKHLFIISFMLAIATSCNNATENAGQDAVVKDSSKPVENKIMIPVSYCYTSNGKDSVSLKVEVFENVVTGSILYKLFEKDSNNGNFEGQLKGDTLLADYTFMSEGTRSVRQVIFLLKDNIALEGYGDMEDKNGKMVFKNTGTVTFGKGVRLQKTNCK